MRSHSNSVASLCPRARERLVQVMVRVDEARRDDRAADVDALVGRGRRAAADVLDPAVRDEDPAVVVLGADVVHRHDVRVVQQRSHSARNGTSSKRSTSTRPRSVIFSAGITDSARNASDWNGASIAQPSSQRGGDDGLARADDLRERRVRQDPGHRQRQLGEHLRAVDDDDAAADVREPAHRDTPSTRRRRRRSPRCARRARASSRARRGGGRSRGRSRGRCGRCRDAARSPRPSPGRAPDRPAPHRRAAPARRRATR